MKPGRGIISTRTGVIITQQKIGQSTGHLAQRAPRLWTYLQHHAARFEARKSSIYRNHPPFSIFGVGEYTFSPYKVVVSSFYRTPAFYAVGLHQDKPLVCDDTCYLLAFDSMPEAVLVAALLNQPLTLRLIQQMSFVGAKRPITKTLLMRLDLRALAKRLADDETQHLVLQVPEIIRHALPDHLESGTALAAYLFPEQQRLF